MWRISCLAQLNFFVLLCCMVSYMLRVNLAITIVKIPDMTAYREALQQSKCLKNSTGYNSTSYNSTSYNSTSYNSTSCANNTTINESSFTYDQWKQNIIQGSFFWGYVLTELPGGRLGEVVGPRLIIGSSVLVASVLNLLTPLASDHTGYYGLIILRLLQGLTLGVIFPSLYPLAAKWVPPMERGKFMSNLLALSLGAAFTYPLCGLLIAQFGWRSVFYVTGSLGLLWTIGWFIFVYDSPAQHPRISPKEKINLDSLIGTTSSNKVFRVPWMKLLKSPPVWAIVITHTCTFMNYSTLSIQLPTFMDHIFHMDVKEIGLFLSIPHVGKYVVGVLTGYVASIILQNEKLSTMNTRRLFVFISSGIPAVLMLLQAQTGHVLGLALFYISMTATLNGAVTGGHLCGGLDIAPNFSGTIFGIANTFGSIGSALSAYFVGHMTADEQTFTQWRPVFWMIGGIYLVGLTAYLSLGSATLKEWNMPKIKHQHDNFDVKSSELQPMNANRFLREI